MNACGHEAATSKAVEDSSVPINVTWEWVQGGSNTPLISRNLLFRAFSYINYILNFITKCTCAIEYFALFTKYPLHVSVFTEPSSGRNLIASQ